MAKDDNSLIFVILGIGALILMSNSSSSEKVKILKKREKAVESGVSRPDARDQNPIPAQKNERKILTADLYKAIQEYKRLSDWEEHNAKQVVQSGLPQDVWQAVVELRSYMVQLGLRGNLHFARSANSSHDTVFWNHWRAIWTGIIHIGQRQADRYKPSAYSG